MPVFHTLDEAAEILRSNKEQVRGFILSGELEAMPIGKGTKRRRWLVSDDAIKAFANQRIAAARRPAKSASRRPTAAKTFI